VTPEDVAMSDRSRWAHPPKLTTAGLIRRVTPHVLAVAREHPGWTPDQIAAEATARYKAWLADQPPSVRKLG
jgi:hypothetical protein